MQRLSSRPRAHEPGVPAAVRRRSVLAPPRGRRGDAGPGRVPFLDRCRGPGPLRQLRPRQDRGGWRGSRACVQGSVLHWLPVLQCRPPADAAVPQRLYAVRPPQVQPRRPLGGTHAHASALREALRLQLDRRRRLLWQALHHLGRAPAAPEDPHLHSRDGRFCSGCRRLFGCSRCCRRSRVHVAARLPALFPVGFGLCPAPLPQPASQPSVRAVPPVLEARHARFSRRLSFQRLQPGRPRALLFALHSLWSKNRRCRASLEIKQSIIALFALKACKEKGPTDCRIFVKATQSNFESVCRILTFHYDVFELHIKLFFSPVLLIPSNNMHMAVLRIHILAFVIRCTLFHG